MDLSKYTCPFRPCGFLFCLFTPFFPNYCLAPFSTVFLCTTKSEIRDAYKLRALETHPDRYPIIDSTVTREEATKAFQKVADAYYVLNNPTQKEKYGMSYRKNNRKGLIPCMNALRAYPSFKFLPFITARHPNF